jgi:hypothetical protein
MRRAAYLVLDAALLALSWCLAVSSISPAMASVE